MVSETYLISPAHQCDHSHGLKVQIEEKQVEDTHLSQAVAVAQNAAAYDANVKIPLDPGLTNLGRIAEDKTEDNVSGEGMVSAQKNTEFCGSDYDGMKNVRSIWICMDKGKESDSIEEISLERNF